MTRQAGNNAIGHDVLAGQLGQCIAGDRRGAILGCQRGVFQGDLQHELRLFRIVFQVALFAAKLDLVERRLGNVYMAAIDQFGHLAIQQGQQQGADVRAIDIGIGHDDDAVIAQLVDVEIGPDAGAQRGDQRGDLLAGDQAIETRFFDVEHFAAQRQDSLEFAIAPLLGRASCGVALDDVDFAQGGVFFLAVGQLARQTGAFQDAFPARHFAGLAGRIARPGGIDDLVAQGLGVGGVFKQPGFQRARHGLFDGGAHFAGDQLVFGLAAELGLGHFYR